MQGKRTLTRASFANDAAFERAVDAVAVPLDPERRRVLLLSLMRDCRGCGNTPTYETVQLHTERRTGCNKLVCMVCGRPVALSSTDAQSVGRAVTLWNNTPLTIEVAAHA